MKAILEFNLPEEQPEHSYALAGVDALITIDDILTELKNKLKYDSGFFKEWTDGEGIVRTGDDSTLERLRELIGELRIQRSLPELN